VHANTRLLRSSGGTRDLVCARAHNACAGATQRVRHALPPRTQNSMCQAAAWRISASRNAARTSAQVTSRRRKLRLHVARPQRHAAELRELKRGHTARHPRGARVRSGARGGARAHEHGVRHATAPSGPSTAHPKERTGIDSFAPNSRLFAACRPPDAVVASASPEPAAQHNECVAAFKRGESCYVPLLRAAHGSLECTGRCGSLLAALLA